MLSLYLVCSDTSVLFISFRNASVELHSFVFDFSFVGDVVGIVIFFIFSFIPSITFNQASEGLLNDLIGFPSVGVATNFDRLNN